MYIYENKSRSFFWGLLFFCIVISFFNYVLRLAPDSISFYRLILPLQALSVMVLSKKIFVDWLITTLLLFIFGSFGILLSGYDVSIKYNLVFFIHYSIILLTFFSMKLIIQFKGCDFFNKWLVFFFFLFTFIGSVEYFIGFRLPNVEAREGVIRGVMKNENDYSLLLSCAAIYILFFNFKKYIKIISYSIALMVSVINDSKLLMLVLLLSGLYFSNSSAIKALSLGFYGKIVTLLTLITLSIVLGYFFIDPILGVKVSGVALSDLLLDPLTRIVTLEPYGLGYGSLMVRTDMTIFAIKDMLYTYGLGIGFGNSLAMVETGRYGTILEGATSIHNFPLQVILELGVLFTLPTIYLILRGLSGNQKMLILLLLLSSISQSVGLFSNYYYLTILSVSFLINTNRAVADEK